MVSVSSKHLLWHFLNILRGQCLVASVSRKGQNPSHNYTCLQMTNMAHGDLPTIGDGGKDPYKGMEKDNLKDDDDALANAQPTWELPPQGMYTNN